jgi:hypothetical protein
MIQKVFSKTSESTCYKVIQSPYRLLLIPLGFNSPPLWGVKLGVRGLVPPHTEHSQGKIFNIPLLCGGDFLITLLGSFMGPNPKML